MISIIILLVSLLRRRAFTSVHAGVPCIELRRMCDDACDMAYEAKYEIGGHLYASALLAKAAGASGCFHTSYVSLQLPCAAAYVHWPLSALCLALWLFCVRYRCDRHSRQPPCASH